MPELPEVETVRRGLAPVVEGRRIVSVLARRADLRRPLPDALAERLQGRRVERLERRAKYLLFGLDDGMVLVSHLGMSGRFRIHPLADLPPPGPHDHLDIAFEGDRVIRYNDPRRFGLIDLVSGNQLADHPLFAHLGPEPVDQLTGKGDLDGALLAQRLAGHKGPIKVVLLDQTVLVGVGNIYASEALFRAGISPKRRADTIVGQRARRLAEAIGQVLEEAIEAGGSTLRDHRQADGELGYFQHRFAVYDREGAPCPGCDCGAPTVGGIRRLIQGGRSTFYCARRQR